jgi:hypothetical protein
MFLIQYYTDAYKYQVGTLYLFVVLMCLGGKPPKKPPNPQWGIYFDTLSRHAWRLYLCLVPRCLHL